MLGLGVFAGIVDGLFHNEKYYTLLANFKILQGVFFHLNDDTLRVSLFHLISH